MATSKPAISNDAGRRFLLFCLLMKQAIFTSGLAEGDKSNQRMFPLP
jgi:hypothetical protein